MTIHCKESDQFDSWHSKVSQKVRYEVNHCEPWEVMRVQGLLGSTHHARRPASAKRGTGERQSSNLASLPHPGVSQLNAAALFFLLVEVQHSSPCSLKCSSPHLPEPLALCPKCIPQMTIATLASRPSSRAEFWSLRHSQPCYGLRCLS